MINYAKVSDKIFVIIRPSLKSSGNKSLGLSLLPFLCFKRIRYSKTKQILLPRLNKKGDGFRIPIIRYRMDKKTFQ